MGYKHYKLLVCDENNNRAQNIEIHTTEDKPQDEIVREAASKYPDKDLMLFVKEDNGEEVLVSVYRNGNPI